MSVAPATSALVFGGHATHCVPILFLYVVRRHLLHFVALPRLGPRNPFSHLHSVSLSLELLSVVVRAGHVEQLKALNMLLYVPMSHGTQSCMLMPLLFVDTFR